MGVAWNEWDQKSAVPPLIEGIPPLLAELMTRNGQSVTAQLPAEQEDTFSESRWSLTVNIIDMVTKERLYCANNVASSSTTNLLN